MGNIKTAYTILLRAVGGRLFILPVSVSSSIGLLERFDVKVEATVSVIWLLIAAPILLWILGRLLIQAVSLQKKVDLDPVPNMSATEVFNYLLLYSKRAVGTNIDDKNYYVEVEGSLRDAARAGRLKVWARAKPTVVGAFRPTLSEIPKEDWEHWTFDLVTCVSGKTNSGSINDYRAQHWRTCEDVCMNKAQVFSLWPKASRWELCRDKQYKRRLEFHQTESNN